MACWWQRAACSKPYLPALLLCGLVNSAPAAPLPESSAMRAALGERAAAVRVLEPHLSTASRPVFVSYRGWPAERVLDRVLGRAWREHGAEVEFRARDGYVARVPGERFREYRAYLVYERVGQAGFSVDNLLQQQKNVPLGPYYLVWDNVRDADLVAEGGTWWPYQIIAVEVSHARADALLPAGMASRFGEVAALAQRYCLSCHQVNGYGGDKWPLNLAQQVKTMQQSVFLDWVLRPAQIKPGTTMPALSAGKPASEREALALRLFDYFQAIPVAPSP